MQGSLSLNTFALMNKALLGKSLWMLSDKEKGLWKQILYAKYGEDRNRWDWQIRWRLLVIRVFEEVFDGQEAFSDNIKFRV